MNSETDCLKRNCVASNTLNPRTEVSLKRNNDAGYRNVRMSKNKSNVRSTRAQIFFKTEKLPPQIFDSLSFVLFAVQWNGIQAGHEENKGGYTSLSAIIIHQAITSRTLI